VTRLLDQAALFRGYPLAVRRDECLNEQWFETLQQARSAITLWRDDYNEVRPPSSCQRMPPARFAELHRQRAGDAAPAKVASCAVAAHHQAFLAINPIRALDVDRPAVDAKAAEQHSVAVAAVLAGELRQALTQPVICLGVLE